MKKKAKAKTKAKSAKKKTTRKAVKVKAKAKKSSKRPVAKAKKTKKGKTKAQSSATPKPGVIAPAGGVLLGYVDDYFAQIGVIALTLQASVAVGQKIQVLGHTTNFEQTVDSMQIEHASVSQAGVKDGVGIKVRDRARCGDHVYLLK